MRPPLLLVLRLAADVPGVDDGHDRPRRPGRLLVTCVCRAELPEATSTHSPGPAPTASAATTNAAGLLALGVDVPDEHELQPVERLLLARRDDGPDHFAELHVPRFPPAAPRPPAAGRPRRFPSARREDGEGHPSTMETARTGPAAVDRRRRPVYSCPLASSARPSGITDVHVGVRARDDVHRHHLADAAGGHLAGVHGGLHRRDVAAHDDGDVAAAGLLVATPVRPWPPSPSRRPLRPPPETTGTRSCPVLLSSAVLHVR